MPLSMVLSPDGEHAALLLGGYREQGLQIVDVSTGVVTQTLRQPSAFIGVAFSPDGRSIYTSGGNGDVVYRYDWSGSAAKLADSLVLAIKAPRASGKRYPAGVAVSRDGRMLYVAENLGDSLAVVDVASARVIQRVATGKYPYGVIVTNDGTVFVSSWDSDVVSSFARGDDGTLRPLRNYAVARHPSALVASADGSRVFVASASTDRVSVIDTRARAVIATLSDAPRVGEGRTINALALSSDGSRLFAAEADANAIAVFDLSSASAGVSTGVAHDTVAGRIPTDWYPTGVIARANDILYITGKGDGTAPNPRGPDPLHPAPPGSRQYTLGQLSGTLGVVSNAELGRARLAELTDRVATLNHWNSKSPAFTYPPFQHVVYVIKENRTYDQVLGDLPSGDGDTALVFFPRANSPNHHALAERFGVYDRFFVNAEVSADGHNWSTAAYATDYLEKTVPSNYSDRGRPYDYEGTNRGFDEKDVPDDDVAEPANGYLWNSAEQAGITFRNFGEFVVVDTIHHDDGPHYLGDKPFLRLNTNPHYAGFDLGIRDQARMDVWIAELNADVKSGAMPALEIVRLPNDHTSGARAGSPTPRAYMADNDLALGRMIDALSHSPFWKNTIVFVLEDDAQNGPDHVDSHRSVLLTISPYNRGAPIHRFVNTTDVLATIRDILHLRSMSPFDGNGHPIREVFTSQPDLRPYVALTPDVSLDEKNPAGTRAARQSAQLDLSAEDRADEGLFNRILWSSIKGNGVPYPGASHAPIAGYSAH